MGLSPSTALAAAAGVLAIALAATLATGDRAAKLGRAVDATTGGVFATLGFTVKAVHVEGASALARRDILKAAGVRPGQPIMGLDLEQVRQAVETVGWVKQARVVRLLPDTLIVAVVEKKKLAVWQQGGRIHVIDDLGRVIPEASADNYPGLPLIVGAGANEHAPQILAEVAGRPRLTDRLEALVRVDDRRWDLRLKDGGLVQLPAEGEDQALIRLDALDQRTRILDLGFERIDLRDPQMLAVRPRRSAPPGQLVADGA